MSQWVQREPALPLGRGVPHHLGRKAMTELVEGERPQEGGNRQQKANGIVQQPQTNSLPNAIKIVAKATAAASGTSVQYYMASGNKPLQNDGNVEGLFRVLSSAPFGDDARHEAGFAISR